MESGNDTAASGTVALLLRRWYLTLTGLVLTIAFGAIAIFMVAPTYQAKASLLPASPKSPATGSNPYLALGGLQGATDVPGPGNVGFEHPKPARTVRRHGNVRGPSRPQYEWARAAGNGQGARQRIRGS